MKYTYNWKKSTKLYPHLQINNGHHCLSHSYSTAPPSYTTIVTYPLPASQSPYDQGNLGSCTGNAQAFLYSFCEIKQNNYAKIMPSRLGIYYYTRLMEGTVNSDSGSTIPDSINSLTRGVFSENIWPYNVNNYQTKPNKTCIAEKSICKATSVGHIAQDLTMMKNALLADNPISAGIEVYSSFETQTVATNGLVPFPNITSETYLGGHNIVIIGYDDTVQCPNTTVGAFYCRNSWGTSWGLGGYFYIPYTYIINATLSSDYWMCLSVTNPLAKTISKLDSKYSFTPYSSNSKPSHSTNLVVNPTSSSNATVSKNKSIIVNAQTVHIRKLPFKSFFVIVNKNK